MKLQYCVNNTIEELHEAGGMAWRIMESWGFHDEEKFAALGYIFSDKFPTTNIDDAQTQAIGFVIDIHNLLIASSVDPELITRPFEFEPFGGRDLKDMIISGGQ